MNILSGMVVKSISIQMAYQEQEAELTDNSIEKASITGVIVHEISCFFPFTHSDCISSPWTKEIIFTGYFTLFYLAKITL